MTTIPLFFITIFVLAQCALGIMLLYRGYTLMLDHFEMESLKNLPMVVKAQFQAQLKAIAKLVTWRRAAIMFSLFVPGSIPILLLVAGWRYVRRAEPGTLWKVSTHRLKTAIQNIAL